MAFVRRGTRWARQQGYIDDHPIADLRIPSAENREAVIRPEDFEQILTFVQDSSLRNLLLFAWETGRQTAGEW